MRDGFENKRFLHNELTEKFNLCHRIKSGIKNISITEYGIFKLYFVNIIFFVDVKFSSPSDAEIV